MDINSEVLGEMGFLGILSYLVNYSGGSSTECKDSEKVKLEESGKKNHCCLQILLGGTDETW